MLVPLSRAGAPWAPGDPTTQPGHAATRTRLFRILLFSPYRHGA